MTVLMAVAIAGIIAATLATVFENMSKLAMRSNATNEIDNLQRYIQGLLSQRSLCRYALRDTNSAVPASNDRVSMPTGVGTRIVGVIRATNGTSTPVLVAQSGMDISPTLEIDEIRIRRRDTNYDDVPDGGSPQPTELGNIAYTIIQAELVISFNWIGGATTRMAGGNVLRPRKIPLLAWVNGSNEVVFCDATDVATERENCTVTDPSCPRNLDFNGQLCLQIPYVERVDNLNRPVCNCREICPPLPGSAGTPPFEPVPIMAVPPPGRSGSSSRASGGAFSSN